MTRAADLQFCIDILPRVSRSFALNIRVLKGDLYTAVLCAYLFCRIVDTVEDHESLPLATRNTLLEEYLMIFNSRDFSSDRICRWINLFGKIDTDDPEHLLIQNVQSVFATYSTLSSRTQTAIAECVLEMTSGMRETVNRQILERTKLHTLKSMAELEQYCYFVAGTVGVMLTRLFVLQSSSIGPETALSMEKLQGSFACGLQMTNIIKDCYEDYQRGWCYIPEEMALAEGVPLAEFLQPACGLQSLAVLNRVIITAARHLDDALLYTLLIPRREVRMRLFNLWSLFFAIKTLRLAWNNEDLLTGSKKVKIPRLTVYRTLWQTSWRVFSNSLLHHLYMKHRTAIS